MNKTAELVNLWADFEADHPDADIIDFCQYHLIKEREKKGGKDGLGGIIPPDLYSKIAKMIGRLEKLHSFYAEKALKNCNIKNFEEFLYLNTIKNTDLPQKTEVIYSNFNELSSGLLILKRLINRDHVNEIKDNEDKRVKRLKLTEKGDEVLQNCYKSLKQVNKMFFHNISDTDLKLCLKLLEPLEVKFSSLWLEQKEDDFEDIYTKSN